MKRGTGRTKDTKVEEGGVALYNSAETRSGRHGGGQLGYGLAEGS